MGMGFAPTWLRQVSPPPPASQKHFNHWCKVNFYNVLQDDTGLVSAPVTSVRLTQPNS